MCNVPYQEAIGSIMCAAEGSRPDIAYAVGAFSRYNHNPGSLHWSAVKRLMRYLKKTANWKLTFKRGNPFLHGCMVFVIRIGRQIWTTDVQLRVTYLRIVLVL